MSTPEPPDAPVSPTDVTRLLREVAEAREGAVDRLAEAVYDELHRTAAAYLRREGHDGSLRPTALVHDAFMRLVNAPAIDWNGRAHFYRTAARAMRRILVDHARRHRATRRDGQHVTLDPDLDGTPAPAVDVLAVDDALEALARLDARQAQVVELRFFAGLSIEETAEALGVSRVTVTRDWAVARAWLHAELSRD